MRRCWFLFFLPLNLLPPKGQLRWRCLLAMMRMARIRSCSNRMMRWGATAGVDRQCINSCKWNHLISLVSFILDSNLVSFIFGLVAFASLYCVSWLTIWHIFSVTKRTFSPDWRCHCYQAVYGKLGAIPCNVWPFWDHKRASELGTPMSPGFFANAFPFGTVGDADGFLGEVSQIDLLVSFWLLLFFTLLVS